MEWLGGCLDGLNGVEGSPSVETPSQSGGCEAKFPELLRHTDASGIAGSTAVGDVLLIGQTILSHVGGPVAQLVGQHPQRTGDLGPIMDIASPSPHIHHQRRVRRSQSTC